MLNIQERGKDYKISLLHLGFRPFFLGACLFAIISMSVWAAVFVFHWTLPIKNVSPFIWHAHEMVFGYSLAVIAGFLLAAVRNWTGVDTLRGTGLLLLWVLWIAARVFWLTPLKNALLYAALVEMFFMSLLLVALLLPVIKVKQWKQLGVLFVVLLFFVCDVLFYLAISGELAIAPQIGLYLGFYLIVLMVFIMARRVIPFFIEKGVGYEIKIKNWLWLDVLSLFVLLIFIFVDVFYPGSTWVAWLALMLAVLHGIRLIQWYTKGIWLKPLLWILYIAYGMFVLGFVLKFAAGIFPIMMTIPLHAFAVGGIGLMTIGMMARVILGHTGRNVFNPPKMIIPSFLLMVTAVVVRVALPLVSMDSYKYWIVISQVLWISSFAIFLYVYALMLVKPRVDGQYG